MLVRWDDTSEIKSEARSAKDLRPAGSQEAW